MLNEASATIRNGRARIKRRWFPSLPSIFLLGSLPIFLLPLQIDAQQQEIRFSVLGLFHAKELLLEEGSAAVLSVAASDASSSAPLVLNGEPTHRQLLFRAEGDRVVVGSASAASWIATARDGAAVAFRLTVPGRIHRVYMGRLTLRARNGELLAVVGMDRETAVASIVAAEMEESAPIEALKAQAVATRSFLAAGARHLDFDFCDTTHCQFLRSPPPSTSRVAQAVLATRRMILLYRGKPLAALYSSRCGGHTRSLREVGMDSGEGYPYYAVLCEWCRRHPLVWRSTVGEGGRSLKPNDEAARIAAARHWGWSAIPGSDFTTTEDGTGVQLEGHSTGHGVGMCQFGAIGMARAGSSFSQILSHYYPNTSLVSSL
jgi:stage II sporulation protein D